MANCPKCGKHLRLIDWKQHCPHCGANIVVYDLQERLMQQADKAEVQHYHFQKKVDNVKGAFVGNKLAIARIFVSLLPLGPLFLPIIKAMFTAPFEAYEGNINILELYNNIEKLGALTSLLVSGNKSDTIFFASVILFVLSFLLIIIHFVLNALACSPKGKIRNTIIDILIILTSVGSAVSLLVMGKGGAVTASLGIGGILYVIVQIFNACFDMYVLKKGIEIKHAQCYCGGIPIEEYFELQKTMTPEELRQEQYNRLQAIQDEKEAKLKEAENNGKEESDV